MIRILQSVNIMDRAGLETMLMNYYRHMNHAVVQFDFLTHRQQEGAYENEIKKMGGIVYHAPRLYIQNLPRYFRYMKSFFEEHKEYKIIHSHNDTMSYFPLLAAKKSEIPIRSAHSHSSKLDKDLKFPIKYLALKQIHNVATKNCACGDKAGQFMFPNSEFKVIRNAVNFEKFAFNKEIRNRKRQELHVKGKFVIGHVGRYCYIKNQLFLLDVFNAVLTKKPESHLLLVGKGQDQYKIEEKIKKLGIEKNVSLLIDRADVAEIYQAMDVFVMPSLFEGLPVVGVEAQANGLQCIVSDKISKEILLTNSIEMLAINDGADKWAKVILNVNRERNKTAKDELHKAGYDIIDEAKKLQQWYVNLYNQI